jgi:hypothetical protein
VIYAVGNALLIAIIGRLASPIVIVPALVSFVTGSIVTYPTFLVRKWLLIGIMLAGFIAPIVLEAYGVLAPSWSISDAGVVIFGDAMYLRGAPASRRS